MTDALKIYSRKQVVTWVESITKYRYEQLKNGVCFCKILATKFPDEFTKNKFNQKPISQFDFTNNLNLVKKILNKNSLQLNMNVNTILNSKNCFQFANWMKNLADGLIAIPNPDYYFVNPQEKVQTQNNLLSARSGNKTKRDSCSSKSGQKTHSLAKSGRPYSTTKSELPLIKIKAGKNLVQVNKQLPALNNNRSHINKLKKSGILSEFDIIEDYSQALYELSLQQSIGQFKKILKKVQSSLDCDKYSSFQEFLEEVRKSLYQK